jgi:2-oxoglutarate dehydrogenase E1 component
MQIVNCTTPSNYFHVLRRQMHRPFRKPLVVFTPKSLLRHPKCISPVKDFAEGKFIEVIDDVATAHHKTSKVIFCSGKIYYDLEEYRQQYKITDTSIIRLEQLYPLPFNTIQTIINRYPKSTKFFWVQEEPENMGAWAYLLSYFRNFPIELISRSESASPATGSHKQHEKEQKELIEKVFS